MLDKWQNLLTAWLLEEKCSCIGSCKPALLTKAHLGCKVSILPFCLRKRLLGNVLVEVDTMTLFACLQLRMCLCFAALEQCSAFHSKDKIMQALYKLKLNKLTEHFWLVLH